MENEKKITVEFTAEELAFGIDGLAQTVQKIYQDESPDLPTLRMEALLDLQAKLTRSLMEEHFDKK